MMTRPRSYHRGLGQPMTAYRIGDPDGAFPVFSPEGAKRAEGRWHRAGSAIVYASRSYATAMLEKLVHWNGVLPGNQHFVEIGIPAGASYEVVTGDILPGWYEKDGTVARTFGHQWYQEGRSLVLLVPSVVARVEQNVVINATHPEYPSLSVGLETPIWWDECLFRP